VARLVDADDDAAQAYLKYLIQLAADNACRVSGSSSIRHYMSSHRSTRRG
jgi:hypothetical protein